MMRARHLLDDSVGDVVLIESDERVHETFRVHQELLLRRLPIVVHLRAQRGFNSYRSVRTAAYFMIGPRLQRAKPESFILRLVRFRQG